MRLRLFTASCTALTLAFAAACASSTAPNAPSPATEASAAADGSTLKVTAPGLMSPVDGVRLLSLQPEFVVSPAQGRYRNDLPLEYRIEVLSASGQLLASSPRLSPGGNGQVRWTFPTNQELDTRYRWRARAEYLDGFGPWSPSAEYLTLDYRGLVPRPFDGRWPTSGPEVVAYIASKFEEYLVVTDTDDERVANMEFLRDRIIEAGICGGLDLARNLKRGVGPHSIDAIAWRIGGRVEVVDLASAYDDHDNPLRLHWIIVAGPPGYDRYTDHPGC